MSKPERQHSYKFGRVFFPEKGNPIPDKVYFQPLGNHVSNVMRLVQNWSVDDFPGKTPSERQASFQRVFEAAKVHDMGKPQKFNIEVKTTPKGKFKEYIYSFRGHRFLATSSDAWAESLAKGHHDFSVGDISRDAYALKKESHYAEILAKDPLAYARELYILEMCDQIEAELACREIGDDEQAESRAFMDYTTAKAKLDSQGYLIDPWPFKDNTISLYFEYWSMELTQADKTSLQNCLDAEQHHKLGNQLDRIAKNWWQSQQGKPEKAEPKSVILQPYQSVNDLKTLDCPSLYKALGGEQFVPNPMQVEMFEAIANNDHPAILLKGSTGSGKTESVLFPALAQGYRLFLPLPARSLLEDQKERIEKYLKQFSKLQSGREISLVVDTGSQMRRWVYRDGEEVELGINPRRHLYKGDVILTTLDKFLYRYFAFGDKQKSFIFPLRIHREKTLICFDEAHSYDEISFTNFQSLVQSLYEAGRSLVLMTATMPPEYHARFDYLELIDYIDDQDCAKKLHDFQQHTLKQPLLNQRHFEWISELERNSEAPNNFQNEFTQIILKEWQASTNRRIIAVVQTVKDAATIYQKLKFQLEANTDTQDRFLFLYHGRIAEQLRPELYKQLQQRDATGQPYILVTTSAIEVGCDLNCEVLISQVCPPENLIQRAGRCNRRGNVTDAKVVVVGDRIPDFANTLDEAGWQNYQKTLQSLKHFDTQAISRCITRSQQVDDYRVVELFSMLHDYVYGADLTCQPAHEKGLVITRSWTPSATLIYEDGTKDPPKTTVPIDRLLKNKGNQYANTHVYERYYNQESTHWDLRTLRWGSAYMKDIVIKIAPNNDGAGMFDTNEEYKYDRYLGFVDLPGVFIRLKQAGFDEKLLFQHKQQTLALITYKKHQI